MSAYRIEARYLGARVRWHDCQSPRRAWHCDGPHASLKAAVACFNARLAEAKESRDAGDLSEGVEVVLLRGGERIARRCVQKRIVIREPQREGFHAKV